MATYTMRADGTAANAAAAIDGDPTVQSECMSIATHNSATFSAGDVIQLADTGGIYRAIPFAPPSSGSSGTGNEITYEAYPGDTPVINGSPEVTGWTAYGAGAGSTWQATLTTDPRQVFMDDVRLTEGASATTLNDLEWFWASNVLYVRRDAGDPDGAATIEAGTDFNYVMTVDQDFLKFDGITFEKGSSLLGMIFGDGGASDNEFVNCTIQHSYTHGFNYYSATTPGYRWEIHSCYFFDNGATPCNPGNYSDNWHIHNNEFDSNCRLTGETAQDYTAAIRCTDTESKNHLIEYNEIHNDTLGKLTAGTDRDGGIWLDGLDVTGGCGVIIRYNICRDLDYQGIRIEITEGAQVYYNLVYDIDGTGIAVQRRVHDNEIYNNTIYSCDIRGIDCSGIAAEADSCTGNIFKNNIAVGNTIREFSVWDGGDNNGTEGSGNVYEYNCFGAEATGFVNVEDAGGALDTYAALESWYGSAMNNVEAEPSFVNAAGGNFRLQSNSPCIDKGVSVGLTQDIEGNTVPS